MFLSQGRGGCASNHNNNPAKPLLRAHSLTGQTLDSKEPWRPYIPHDREPPLCLPQAPDPMSLLSPSPKSLVPLEPYRTVLTAPGLTSSTRVCLAPLLREERASAAPSMGLHTS